MREILFRAKRKLNGDWVYGSFVQGDDEDWDYIVEKGQDLSGEGIDSFKIRIISNSVGQFTGLCDKNRSRIFEHDRCSHPELGAGIVKFSGGGFMITYPDENDYTLELSEDVKDLTVIGTIHDVQHKSQG